jgi:hypothetical protein
MALFVPSSQLLIAVGDSQQAQKFVLSSREWIDLQNNIQAVLALPFDLGEYEQRYGDATSGLQMKECFDAMRILRNVASKYGDPKGLRANIVKNPNYLANAERPKNNAYSSTVWTLERVHQDAFKLASVLRSIPINARDEKPAEVVAGIKSIFLNTDQIVDRMRRTVQQLDVLIKEFQVLEDELEVAQAAMRNYTERSSTTRMSLDKEIGGLKDKIEQLEIERDAAYQKWLDLTIAACVAPAAIAVVGIGIMVILAIPTGGASFAVGSAITGAAATVAGTALGVSAALVRTSYDNMVQEISTKQDLMQKRIAYRHDLGALDDSMKFSLPSSNGMISQIRVLREAWNSSINEIQYKVANLSTDDLASGPWLKDQEMAASAANWIKVDDALKAFINGSFVDSDVLTFGKPLPKADPDWQKKLASKLAA